MVKEAEINAGEDKKRRDLIEAKNKADSLIYSTEKSLKDYGDKIAASDKQEVEQAITDLKSALESEDSEQIKAKTDALSTSSMKIGEAMYKDSQEANNAAGGVDQGQTAQEPDDGKVVDANYEDLSKKDQ